MAVERIQSKVLQGTKYDLVKYKDGLLTIIKSDKFKTTPIRSFESEQGAKEYLNQIV